MKSKSINKIVLSFSLAFLAMSCSNNDAYHNDLIPKHDSFTMASTHVNEDRVINIWTPPAYDESSESYAVLYMPDGGIKEDFPHITNTLDKLIADNQVPPFILVGIENTERGRDMTGFSEIKDDEQYCPLSDGAKNFRAFIAEELIPQIDAKYRTTSRKGIIGESLAGLFVVETFFTEPEAFDFYIAMDPSLWWNDHYLARNADSLLSAFPHKEIKLWFAGSAAEDISRYTRSIEKTLEKSSPATLTWRYSDEQKEEHHTIYRATKEKAMVWSLND